MANLIHGKCLVSLLMPIQVNRAALQYQAHPTDKCEKLTLSLTLDNPYKRIPNDQQNDVQWSMAVPGS